MENTAENLLKEIFNKQKDGDKYTPEEITKEIINLTKTFSIERNTTELNSIFIINNKGQFIPCPMSSEIVHGPMGEMLFKAYLKSLMSLNEIHSIVDINFAHGVVAKFQENQLEECETYHEQIKQDVIRQSKKGDKITHPDFQDYLVINILKKEGVDMLIYDVIQNTDKTSLVISPNPIIEEIVKYDNKQFINYFK